MTDVLDINTVLGIALATLVSWLVRWLKYTRFWLRVTSGAKKHLDDPTDPISDPHAAAERALLEAQQASVQKVAASISPPPATPRTKTIRGISEPRPPTNGGQ